MSIAYQQRKFLFIVLLVFATVWFGSLQYRKLVHPDEGRYAEIPREMLATGNWLTPRLNGIKYFEKPPLQYWATATAFAAFGLHDWTARLWSAVTGFLGVLLVCYTGRRMFDDVTGNYAAMVLASAALYVGIGHFNSLDMGVTLFLSGALCGFLIAQREDSTRDEERLWMLFAWGMMALATLSKGLIGAALPLLTLIAYCIVQRDFGIWRRLHLKMGLLLYFALTAPWFIAVSIVNPEFAQFFFIQEHFARYATTVHQRTGPIWYFVPVLLIGMLPWLLVFFAAFGRSWPKDPLPVSFNSRRFLIVYIVVVFVFFSLSGSKLISYILPLFPAAALLTGWYLTRIRGRTLAWLLIPMLGISLALTLYSWSDTKELRGEHVPTELYDAYLVWLRVALVMLTAGLAYSVACAFKEKTLHAVVATALSALTCAQLAMTGYEALSPVSSAYSIASAIAPYMKPGVPIYSVHGYDQTLPFYLKHTVVLVEFKDEMDYGLQQEPQLAVTTLSDFESRWKRHPDALAFMHQETYDLLARQHFPMQVVARDPRNIVVKKP